MPPAGQPNDSPEPESGTDGVSALAARVLGQLALSSWLPAALFVAGGAVLLVFRRLHSINLLAAISRLSANPVRLAVVIVPVLVITAFITQAFAFGAIRMLQGNWPLRGPLRPIAALMLRRQLWMQRRLGRRLKAVEEAAFTTARYRLLRAGRPFPVVDALEAEVCGLTPPPLTPAERAEADAMDWQRSCTPLQNAEIARLKRALDRYPAPARLLPTKLGNLIRATTDRLEHAGGNVVGFVWRRRDAVPARLQEQLDQFRSRLDMYCTLVFVSACLAALSVALLAGHVSVSRIVLVSSAFALLGAASYAAALASASGYCDALEEMDRTPVSASAPDDQ